MVPEILAHLAQKKAALDSAAIYNNAAVLAQRIVDALTAVLTPAEQADLAAQLAAQG